jgi:hypothetical protein
MKKDLPYQNAKEVYVDSLLRIIALMLTTTFNSIQRTTPNYGTHLRGRATERSALVAERGTIRIKLGTDWSTSRDQHSPVHLPVVDSLTCQSTPLSVVGTHAELVRRRHWAASCFFFYKKMQLLWNDKRIMQYIHPNESYSMVEIT